MGFAYLLYLCTFKTELAFNIMSQSPAIPSGTRDFAPAEVARRCYIFDAIRSVFHAYGFMPIETPAMENLSTLLGKYGSEGDKLLFKVLNSGNALSKLAPEDLDAPSAALKVCEKGLRYDLTVPFARYVAQYQSQIALPFRRYQIQPVWRADRPQKGRYREFWQCDADIAGSASLLNEAELMLMTDSIFEKLGIGITLKINNRKVLSGIAEAINAADKLTDITTAIDKIDKAGIEKVSAELAERGIAAAGIARLLDILQWREDSRTKLQKLRALFACSEAGLRGVQELETLLDYLDLQPPQCRVEVDLSLARGLNYYTGAIFEVKANDADIGSISGGGRYDNLTGVFGLIGISGVGISFGADRIYDVMEQLGLFPSRIGQSAKIMFVNLGKREEAKSLELAQMLRRRGIAAEIYPDPRKLQKQMEYANRRRIPYVAVIGESELQQGGVSIKDMHSGGQRFISEAEFEKMAAEFE